MAIDVVRARGARLRWYTARLRAMTPAEIAWRGASEVRARLPRPAAPRPRWGSGGFAEVLAALAESSGGGLARDADVLAEGVVELWGRRLAFSGDWQAHPDGGRWPDDGNWRRWERDPKGVWELHRHQHLLALAAGGRADHRHRAVAELEGWVRANPPGTGPAWASAYETAHRLFAWPFLLGAAAADADAPVPDLLAESYAEQRAFVERRPSRYSSANNHRLAELVGLLAAALAVGDAAAWDACLAELTAEAERQTFSDGGTREQAAGYFLYVLEILWGALLLCLGAGRDAGTLRDVVRRMLSWYDAVAGVDGELPPVGDDAEDRWLRLPYFAPRSAAALATRVERALAGEPSLAAGARAPAGESRVLRESGYAVLRGRTPAGEARVVLDVGELGYGSLAAHGHADALSVLVDLDGVPLLLDSGTGSYLSSRGRAEFRGTGAHNTVRVERADQAEQLGPHLWGARYDVVLEEEQLDADGAYLRASHDGYRRAYGAMHTRCVWFRPPGLLVVLDRVRADRDVTCDLRWHVAARDDPRASLTVVSAQPAAESVEDAPRSPRYDIVESGPCRQWRSTGAEVLFATVVAFGGPPPEPVALERESDGAVRLTLGAATFGEPR